MRLVKTANFFNPIQGINNVRKRIPWTPVFRGLDVLSLASMPAYFLIPDATTRTQTANIKKLEANPDLQKGVEALGKTSIANPLPNTKLPGALPPNSLR
jgi:hypothetical protein